MGMERPVFTGYMKLAGGTLVRVSGSYAGGPRSVTGNRHRALPADFAATMVVAIDPLVDIVMPVK